MIVLNPTRKGQSRTTRDARAGRMGSGAWLVLVLLLIAPGIALERRMGTTDDLWITLGVLAVMSLVTYFAYRSDKRSAEQGTWRIPEVTLHAMEFLGGWPGAFVAQRRLRHKTIKGSYQIVFWPIVLLHQFLAVDSLQGWSWTKQAVVFVRTQLS